MKKLYDVVVLRSFAIVMVVAYHAYGLICWGLFPEMTENFKDLYYNVNEYVVNFRMPLFVLISGYLFSYLERERGKYPTFGALFKNKFKRLIVPYFVFAIFYMLTIEGGFDLKDLMSGDCAHLWFVTMLFWCFIFTRLVELLPWSHKGSFQILLLVFSFIISLVDVPKVGLLGIDNLPEWFFWFYLGHMLSPHRDKLFNYLSRRKIWLFIFVLVYALELLYTLKFVESVEARNGIVRLGHLSIVLLIWYMVNWLINNSTRMWYDNVVFKELNRTSYGIYVLHFWLQQYMVSSTMRRLLPIDAFAAKHIIVFPFLFFLTSLMASYIGAKILLKTRIGRNLIG